MTPIVNEALSIPKQTIQNTNSMYVLPHEINREDEILSSFQHALYIQQSVFGSPETFVKRLGFDSFLMFKPKDTVSGDFYWTFTVCDTTVVIIGDCTGHGMPGAFLSLFAQSACSRAVIENRLTHPVQILQKINSVFTDSFGVDNNFRFLGMDVSVCCINKSKKIMECAGAGNPIWLARNNQLIELNGARCSVGQWNHLPASIHSFTIQLTEDDTIYMFTDGLEDQFGQATLTGRARKLLKKRLRLLLLETSALPINKQKKHLTSFLQNWKQDNEQTDDISLLGIKIGA